MTRRRRRRHHGLLLASAAALILLAVVPRVLGGLLALTVLTSPVWAWLIWRRSRPQGARL
jgi:hypothetical protein